MTARRSPTARSRGRAPSRHSLARCRRRRARVEPSTSEWRPASQCGPVRFELGELTDLGIVQAVPADEHAVLVARAALDGASGRGLGECRGKGLVLLAVLVVSLGSCGSVTPDTAVSATGGALGVTAPDASGAAGTGGAASDAGAAGSGIDWRRRRFRRRGGRWGRDGGVRADVAPLRWNLPRHHDDLQLRRVRRRLRSRPRLFEWYLPPDLPGNRVDAVRVRGLQVGDDAGRLLRLPRRSCLVHRELVPGGPVVWGIRGSR